MTVRTRVAPSPTGDPHVGTLYQALFDYILARQSNGQFVLRIEDTDRTRFVPGSEERVINALKWAGLTYDEGPIRQSERLPLYKKHATELVKKGYAYYCFCTADRLDDVRKEQEKNHQPPKYDRFCRDLSAAASLLRVNQGEPYVIRLRIPGHETITVHDELRGDLSFASDILDYQVLLKSDGFPTYHLAVVVDDHDMGITDAVRGEEWLPSSPKHNLLYRYFDWELPRWYHLPLLRNTDRSKLSKRKNNTSVDYYIKAGYLPEALLNFLLLSVWGREKGKERFSLASAVAEFNINQISIAAPIFDVTKLDWLNGEWIRSLSDDELTKRLQEFYQGVVPENLYKPEIISLTKERMKRLSDFAEVTKFLAEGLNFDPQLLIPKNRPAKEALDLLTSLTKVFSELPSQQFTSSGIENIVRAEAEKKGLPAREAFMILRVAMTGSTTSLPLNESMIILGRDEVLKRLNKAAGKLSTDNS